MSPPITRVLSTIRRQHRHQTGNPNPSHPGDQDVARNGLSPRTCLPNRTRVSAIDANSVYNASDICGDGFLGYWEYMAAGSGKGDGIFDIAINSDETSEPQAGLYVLYGVLVPYGPLAGYCLPQDE